MRALVIATVSTLLLASCAHGPMGPGPSADRHGMHAGGGMGAMAGCPGHDAEAHLAHLRVALSITPAQDAAWNAYAAAYRAHAAAMPMRAGMGAGMGPMTGSAPERMRHHEEMMASHLESMRALRTNLEALYAALTPEQRAAADALQCARMHGR